MIVGLGLLRWSANQNELLLVASANQFPSFLPFFILFYFFSEIYKTI